MSRDVCGICWCTYDDDGECGCKPVKVIDPAADEALLRQALEALEGTTDFIRDCHHVWVAVTALRERLK